LLEEEWLRTAQALALRRPSAVAAVQVPSVV
jgi:hypothetical protein